MTPQDRKSILSKIESNGFDPAIDGWDYPEIKDKRFHELRRAYVQAAQDLEDYLEEKD